MYVLLLARTRVHACRIKARVDEGGRWRLVATGFGLAEADLPFRLFFRHLPRSCRLQPAIMGMPVRLRVA